MASRYTPITLVQLVRVFLLHHNDELILRAQFNELLTIVTFHNVLWSQLIEKVFG